MTPADLADAIVAAVRHSVEDGDIDVPVPSTVTVTRPKIPEHGDYASPVALQLAKVSRRPPREVAETLAARLRDIAAVASVDVAGPGFLNIRLAEEALGAVARTVVQAGPAYGRASKRLGQRVNLEFVSANPTGPVTLASARWAAVGDSLARLLDAAGYDVGAEYYVNDAGVQVARFGASLLAAARGLPAPADGYHGGYVAEIAERVVATTPSLAQTKIRSNAEYDVQSGTPTATDEGNDEGNTDEGHEGHEGGDEAALAEFGERGVALMLAEIRSTLESFGVHFDVWASEKALHDAGALDAAIAELRSQGRVYDADGAVWLRTSDFGDDKDRPLVKRDGALTYFCADAAYYRDKRRRGFDRIVYLFGADHHGYVARLKAIAACFGDDPSSTIDVIIGQLVTMTRSGKPVKMSKRAGTFVTLLDLLDAVGRDAARYSLVRASLDSALDLDLDLITKRTSDNPVFYVQYAHARIRSLLRNATALGMAVDEAGADVSLLAHPRESDLLRALGELPRVVAAAASLRAPHRLARYLEELAGTYHRFNDACRVLPQGDEEPSPRNHARLLLVAATGVVLANGLALLGVSAPERM